MTITVHPRSYGTRIKRVLEYGVDGYIWFLDRDRKTLFGWGQYSDFELVLPSAPLAGVALSIDSLEATLWIVCENGIIYKIGWLNLNLTITDTIDVGGDNNEWLLLHGDELNELILAGPDGSLCAVDVATKAISLFYTGRNELATKNTAGTILVFRDGECDMVVRASGGWALKDRQRVQGTRDLVAFDGLRALRADNTIWQLSEDEPPTITQIANAYVPTNIADMRTATANDDGLRAMPGWFSATAVGAGQAHVLVRGNGVWYDGATGGHDAEFPEGPFPPDVGGPTVPDPLVVTGTVVLNTTVGIRADIVAGYGGELGGMVEFYYTQKTGTGPSVRHDIVPIVDPANIDTGPLPDGVTLFMLYGKDGSGRTASWYMGTVSVTPLNVSITTAEWYGYQRVAHIVGRVTGYYHTPTVSYATASPNVGSGAVTIDVNGNFDFTASAGAPGATAITVTALEVT